MADNFEQLSDDALEPMQVDWTSERRTLRKRKEKVPKHLKRGVNEKEMDNFTKEFLGYPWKSHSRRLTLPTGCGCFSGKPRKLSRIYIGYSISSEIR